MNKLFKCIYAAKLTDLGITGYTLGCEVAGLAGVDEYDINVVLRYISKWETK